MNPEDKKTEDEKRTFDMYHFFSRADVILFGIFILFLLLLALYLVFADAGTAHAFLKFT